jgi:RNA recognition motif-containing protein
VVIKEGTPRHGYVNFATPQQALAAADSGDVVLRSQFASVTLSKRRVPPALEGEPSDCIGIFNMPFTMTKDQVTAVLGQFPGFHTLKYITTKTGEFRGYCFAYFNSVDNATLAKASLAGFPIGDQILDVKYPQRPEEPPGGGGGDRPRLFPGS